MKTDHTKLEPGCIEHGYASIRVVDGRLVEVKPGTRNQ